MSLEWDGQRLTLSRPALKDGSLESRYWRGELSALTLLFDRSSLEIFINDGEAVMSGRYFPKGQGAAARPGRGAAGSALLAVAWLHVRISVQLHQWLLAG